MTRPITASLSASVLVSDAVRCQQLSTVPPSPCSVWMISNETSLTVWGRAPGTAGGSR